MPATTSGLTKLWSVDRDAKRVAVAMLAALVFGGIAVVFGTLPWPGLLWAGACSAVGWFLGFLFGIPRSLSSDTARTGLPVQPGISQGAARAKAAKDVAAKAGASKTEADRNAAEKAAAAKVAADQAALARAAADAAPGDEALVGQAVALERAAAAQAAAAKQAVDQATVAKEAADQAAAASEAADQSSANIESNAVGASAPGTMNLRGPSTTVNTNLEQISDWLTKIIVGVTLVEIGPAIERVKGAATVIADSLGPYKPVSFAYAIIIYFSTAGFLGSYLLTRLFLQRAFSEADSGETGDRQDQGSPAQLS